MNSFRSPELVKRYEYNYYDLQTLLNDNVANNNYQVIKTIIYLLLTIQVKQIQLIGIMHILK